MKPITLDLARRDFMAGVCAVAAKVALTPTGAIAGDDAGSTYRSATDLIQALAAANFRSRATGLRDHTHRSARPKGQRGSRARL
jgi:hypothetical protein